MIMATRKRFSTEEILRMIDMSEDENFDDNDSDRDSDIVGLADVVDSDGDSDATEAYDLPTVDEAGIGRSDDPDSDVESFVAAASATEQTNASASTSAFTPRVWQVVDGNYTPNVEFQYHHTAGLNSSINLTAESSPIEFFKLFLTDDVLMLMVNESNRFADQFLQKTALKRKARAHNWEPTTASEMGRFLGLIFLMGYVHKAKIEDYWSTDPNIATPIFNQTMPRDRFEILLKFWHYSNNEESPENDRLFKLRHICDLLVARFQAVYTMERDVSIDESMVLWRGRLTFRQFIPGKRHKYGVKLYLLCEPSGYIYNMLVYCGKMDAISGFGHAETVVLKLMDGILDRGHVLYTDNFYTSVPLAQQLLDRKTYLCGTLRKNRKHLPEKVVSAKLKKNDVVALRSREIMVSKWKDKRDVMMLSTIHAGRIFEGGKRNRRGELIKKPDCVLDYNVRMCGVDRLDQLLSYYSPLRKTLKWYRKVVLQTIDMAMSNAFLMYKRSGGNRRQIWFRSSVVSSLMNTQDRPAAASVVLRGLHHNKASDLSRLSGQHYMDVLPPTERKQAPCTRCVVCHKRGIRKETRYICSTCVSKPALCVVPCFKDYHFDAQF